MNPWGVPSGGDWGLYRGGAIFVEGAEDITLQHNTLTRLDGNGVFVSGSSTARPLFSSAPLSPPPVGSRDGGLIASGVVGW